MEAESVMDNDRDSMDLETKATELVTGVTWNNDVLSVIEREVQQAVEHIEAVRKSNEENLERLLKIECYVDTELIQQEARMPRYTWYRFPEREKLTRRLLHIEDQRRQVIQDYEESLRKMKERLLEVVNRLVQLKP